MRLVRRKQRILLHILLLVLAWESYARINGHPHAQIVSMCLLRGNVASLGECFGRHVTVNGVVVVALRVIGQTVLHQFLHRRL